MHSTSLQTRYSKYSIFFPLSYLTFIHYSTRTYSSLNTLFRTEHNCLTNSISLKTHQFSFFSVQWILRYTEICPFCQTLHRDKCQLQKQTIKNDRKKIPMLKENKQNRFCMQTCSHCMRKLAIESSSSLYVFKAERREMEWMQRGQPWIGIIN